MPSCCPWRACARMALPFPSRPARWNTSRWRRDGRLWVVRDRLRWLRPRGYARQSAAVRRGRPVLHRACGHCGAGGDQLAVQTWHSLRQCHDLKIRLDEDAITTQLLVGIATQLNATVWMPDGRKDEAR